MIGDLGARDATALAELVAAGEVSPEELLDAALAAVAARNPEINAVVLMQEEVARRSIASGLPNGPFRGVPFLLKDLGCEAVDFPSHNGSRLLADTQYRRDSAIYSRIRATGVVTFGRTTSPEGGIGAATAQRLAAEGVQRVYLDGGATIRQGLDEGIVDDMTLSIVPVLLGSGRPLFSRGLPGSAWMLTGAEGYPTGLVQLRYQRR
jgi:NAD(P)-dependent dehydrogenase (short-subunit alcohol dehydrogenase family)